MAHATVGEQEWVDGVLDPETLAALVRQFRTSSVPQLAYRPTGRPSTGRTVIRSFF